MITTQTISKIVNALSYIHAALFLIMITPLLYGIGEVGLENSTFVIVLKCLIILLPVIITKKAELLSKNLVIYLLICTGTTALMLGITYLPFRPLSIYGFCYTITIVTETILLSITRLIDRLKKVDDFLSAKEPSIFDRPKVGYSWYFVLIYLIGILFNSKLLCDVAFWATIIYMVTAFGYEYLTSTKHYLYLNNRTKGIPRKRLYGISTAMVLLFLMICLIGILPSIFMSGYRKYTDIRHWMDDMPPIEVELEGSTGYGSMGADYSIMDFLEQDGEVKEPSKLWGVLLWTLGIVCMLICIYGSIQAIRQIFKDFRNTLDENGDIIEEIKDDEAKYQEDELYIKGRHIDSEAMRIRRKYKKTIKKHRKDLPAPYEAPKEIELNAGLIGSEDMETLHSEYENARYGRL
jgi:hypothetical protein